MAVICCLVKGVGHVIGEKEICKASNGVGLSYPALAIPMEDPRGKKMWSLDSVIPSFLEKPSEAARTFYVETSDILFEHPVNEGMTKVYMQWREGAIKAFSGLILPGNNGGVVRAK